MYCTQNKLVPCGRSDLPGVDTVKLYCPSCVDMYVPPSSRFLGVDGRLSPWLFLCPKTDADDLRRILWNDFPSPPLPNLPLRSPLPPLRSSRRRDSYARTYEPDHIAGKGVRAENLRIQSGRKGEEWSQDAVVENEGESDPFISSGDD